MNRTVVNVSGVENFRRIDGYTTLGGKKVKPNMLYRSAKLDKLDDEGIKTLDMIGVRTIVDFRDDVEVEKHPTRYTKASIVHIPIINGDIKHHLAHFIEEATQEDATKLMCKLYKELVTDCGEQYARFFNLLLNPAHYPILFHCTAGKDRTGFAAATLMSLLDVNFSDVIDNYMQTNGELKSYNGDERISQLPENLQQILTVMMSADRRFIETSFETISNYYGSIQTYFSDGLGISLEQQRTLKQLLLE